MRVNTRYTNFTKFDDVHLVEFKFKFNVALRLQKPYGLLRTSTSTFTQLLSSVALEFQVQCCFTSTETQGLLVAGSTGRTSWLSHSYWVLWHWSFKFKFSVALRPQTQGTISGGEHRTYILTFTQLLSSVALEFQVQVQCCFTSTDTRTISGGEHRTYILTFTQLLSSVALEFQVQVQCCFTSTEIQELLGTGSPGRTSRLSHSSWDLNSQLSF